MRWRPRPAVGVADHHHDPVGDGGARGVSGTRSAREEGALKGHRGAGPALLPGRAVDVAAHVRPSTRPARRARVAHGAGSAVPGAARPESAAVAHGSGRPAEVEVPVTLHHDGDQAGDRDSSFRVDLPVDRARSCGHGTVVDLLGRPTGETGSGHRAAPTGSDESGLHARISTPRSTRRRPPDGARELSSVPGRCPSLTRRPHLPCRRSGSLGMVVALRPPGCSKPVAATPVHPERTSVPAARSDRCAREFCSHPRPCPSSC
jgi:hypothetical protein